MSSVGLKGLVPQTGSGCRERQAIAMLGFWLSIVNHVDNEIIK